MIGSANTTQRKLKTVPRTRTHKSAVSRILLTASLSFFPTYRAVSDDTAVFIAKKTARTKRRGWLVTDTADIAAMPMEETIFESMIDASVVNRTSKTEGIPILSISFADTDASETVCSDGIPFCIVYSPIECSRAYVLY